MLLRCPVINPPVADTAFSLFTFAMTIITIKQQARWITGPEKTTTVKAKTSCRTCFCLVLLAKASEIQLTGPKQKRKAPPSAATEPTSRFTLNWIHAMHLCVLLSMRKVLSQSPTAGSPARYASSARPVLVNSAPIRYIMQDGSLYSGSIERILFTNDAVSRHVKQVTAALMDTNLGAFPAV